MHINLERVRMYAKATHPSVDLGEFEQLVRTHLGKAGNDNVANRFAALITALATSETNQCPAGRKFLCGMSLSWLAADLGLPADTHTVPDEYDADRASAA